MVKPLEVFCVSFLLDYLEKQDYDPSMFFTIFQFCVDCSIDKRLSEKCMTILRADSIKLILENGKVRESFRKISQKCLTRFLDFSYAKEIYLFDAVSFRVFVL